MGNCFHGLATVSALLFENLGFVVEDWVLKYLFDIFLRNFYRFFARRAQMLAAVDRQVYFVVTELLRAVLGE